MLLNLLIDTQSLDIWHDTVFQLIVVIIATLLSAFIGGAIAIWVYRRQKSKKEITYQVVSDAPIASINQAVADRVELRFDGNPIHEARILVLKMWNSGNLAVKRDDYEEPITFTFHGRTVVSSDILETEPPDLIDPKTIKTFLTFQAESVEFPKFLLNPKQSISITTLLTGAKKNISTRGRIIDGNVVELKPTRRSKFYQTITVLANTVGLLVITIIIVIMDKVVANYITVLAIAALTGLITAISVIVLENTSKNK